MNKTELNIRVGREVMRLPDGALSLSYLPDYADDMNMAMSVVNKLRSAERVFVLSTILDMRDESLNGIAKFETIKPYRAYFEIDQSPSRAICLAALKLVVVL